MVLGGFSQCDVFRYTIVRLYKCVCVGFRCLSCLIATRRRSLFTVCPLKLKQYIQIMLNDKIIGF